MCRSDTGRAMACFGLFVEVPHEIYVYIVIVVCSLLIYLIKLYRTIFDKNWIKNHQPYYISTIVNCLLADLFTIAYSTILIIADLMSINWLIWRKHMICNLLRLLVSICLHCIKKLYLLVLLH